MAVFDPVQRSAATLLRGRILVVLSSGSVAAALMSAGGCGGDVDGDNTRGAGTGGSGSGTTGGTAGSGRGGSGAATAGSSGRGGTSSGGTGAVAGSAGRGGASGIGGSAGVLGYGGSAGVLGSGGSGASGGSLGTGGGTNCSPANYCLTCEQVIARFSYFLDGFSCGDGGPWACPNLQGAGTMACENVCTEPVAQGELCCYGLAPALPACGRPFSVGDELRRAPLVSRADWKRFRTGDEHVELDPKVARRLAAEWEEDAVLEHASIASFARLTLELLALGAPADLVRESQAASLDEVDHAERCFELASRYRGSPIGPGVLSIDGALARPDLVVLAEHTVREGCVGETLAALLATAQLERATDPKVCAALTRIADDEARHAELSWKIVRWAIATGGKPVADAARLAFERALAASSIESGSSKSIGDDFASDSLHAHGRLLSDERRAVVGAGLADVIEPCARALLG